MGMNLWGRARDLLIEQSLRLLAGTRITVEERPGVQTTASAAELIRAIAVRGRNISITASLTLQQAIHEGRVLVLNSTSALTVTLPKATGSGARYSFVVGTRNTNSYVIRVADAVDIMQGVAFGAADGGDTVNGWEAGATADTVTLNGSTLGGYVGDMVDLVDVAPGVWAVSARLAQTGTEATPFSATVS